MKFIDEARIEVVASGTVNGEVCLCIKADRKKPDPKQNPDVPFLMPNVTLASPTELLKFLLKLGVDVEIANDCIGLLRAYIHHSRPSSDSIIETQLGWVNDECYVFPHVVLVANSTAANRLYVGSASPKKTEPKGTLADWVNHVAIPCQNNKYLLLCLCASLSSMLVHFIDIPGFGIHIVGNSSTGKSSALKAAASVFGSIKGIINKWNSTRFGLEVMAEASNHMLLALDEINQADPKTIIGAAYTLVDGVGKARGNADLELRELKQWKTVLISNGEETMADYQRKANGTESKAGDQVRIVDIIAHSTVCSNKEHSQKISDAVSKYYGTAAPAFIQYILDKGLMNSIAGSVKEAEKMLEATTKLPTAQSQRIAVYFALMIIAGSIAKQAGLIPGFNKELLIEVLREVADNFPRDIEITQYATKLKQAMDTGTQFEPVNQISTGEGIHDYTKVFTNTIGYVDNDIWYIGKSGLEKLYDTNKPQRIIAKLKEAGILSAQSLQKKIHNKNGKYYTINKELLEDMLET